MWRRAVALLLLLTAPAAAPAQRGGFVDTDTPVSPAGVRARIDLPPHQCMRNVGGSDGAGLCVYTSGEMAGRWQYVPELDGFQDYMRTVPGGGTPQKFERDLQNYCRQKGVPVPPHVQHTGGDVAFLEACFKTRRMPCMTYSGRDNFYPSYVPHMVSGVHLDAQAGAVMDNNRPGKTTWMSRAAFLERWKEKGGWAYAWLAPPPPPDPGGAAPGPPGPGPAPPPAPVRPRPRPCPCPGDDLADWPVIGQPAGDDYEWRATADPGCWNLYRGGRLAGSWCGGKWYPEAGGGQVWATPRGSPPVAPPTVAGVEATALQQIGVRYWVDGVEVTRDQAFAALGAEIPDDAGRFFLTHVGDKGEGAAAVARLKADPVIGRFAVGLHLRTIGPESWIARERLRPGIAFQQPAERGGKVECFATDPTDPKLAEAVRRCMDPDYRPAPEPAPGPRPWPGPSPGPAPKPRPPCPPRDVPGPVAALAVLGWLITRKPK